MKRLFYASFILILSIVSCQQDIERETQTPTFDDESRPFLVDVSGESDANFALIYRDGTFFIYDKDNDSGHEMVYIGAESNGKRYDKGMTLLLDDKHLPKYAYYNGDTYFFSNFSNDTFDLAVVFANGETQFFWDIETGVLVDNYLNSFSETTKASDSFNFWAGLAYKSITYAALGAALGAAIVSGGPLLIIGATAAVGIQALAEANKSGFINLGDNAAYVLDGMSLLISGATGGVASVVVGALTSVDGMIGDNFLNSIKAHDESIANDFSTEEWQIKLGALSLECGPEAASYSVIVNSKAAWTYEILSNQDSFCSFKEDGSVLSINTLQFDKAETRVCQVRIKTKEYREDIHPAKLTITQSGFLFELSESEISFNENGGEVGVTIDKNDLITTWELAYPEWCDIEEGVLSFFVKVPKAPDTERYGVIHVIGYPKNHSPIEKTINVSQIPDNRWNGTTWYIHEATYKGYTSYPSTSHHVSYYLHIDDAKTGAFTVNPDFAWQPDTMGLLSSGQLFCTSTYLTNQMADWYWEYTITKIDCNHIVLEANGIRDGSKSGRDIIKFTGKTTGFRIEK